MRCVCSVTYYVRINGKPSRRITPSRGLRQGDPLSPYLFLLCAEGLSGLIRQQVGSGNLKGVAVCRGAPRISHLFFADDSLIFCRATMGDCSVLQQVFSVYEAVSGQQLNRNKTALFFSRNTPRALQDDIQRRFGVPVIRQHEKYLGLPALVGRSKRNSFNDIKAKLGNKLSG